MNNERLKESFEKWKPMILQAAALCVCFASGYMAGRGEESVLRRDLNSTNYSKKPATNTNTTPVKSPPNQNNCPIKGNIGTAGKKTYHLPGGAFYKRTTAEQCFNTEEEAVASGFAKSSR